MMFLIMEGWYSVWCTNCFIPWGIIPYECDKTADEPRPIFTSVQIFYKTEHPITFGMSHSYLCLLWLRLQNSPSRGSSTSTHLLSSRTRVDLSPRRRATFTLLKWNPLMWATTRVWSPTWSPKAAFRDHRHLWSSGLMVTVNLPPLTEIYMAG